MKTCFKCNIEQPLENFYKHPQMADGHLGKCKTCAKNDARSQRGANLSSVRAYDRERGRTGERKAKARAYQKKNRDRIAPTQKAWIARNPEKRAAHIAVGNAVRNGNLVKGVCEACGVEQVEAHHDDYSRPLEVRWLCRKHHAEHHRRYPEDGP